MNEDKGVLYYAICALALLIVMVIFTPEGRSAWNTYWAGIQKTDDATNYATQKEVEDTCRAMISSYESDKRTYMQYRDSESAEQRSWAEQAKMRANKTAASYNNYILQNTFVWSGNVPEDIKKELPYLEGEE